MDITDLTDTAPVLRALPSRLLGQTAALVGKVTADALAAESAHRYQYAVLATLDAFGASSQADLCRRTDIDRSDMNSAINVLEAEGSVTRSLDPTNRRRNIIDITPSGRMRFDRLTDRLKEAERHALAPLNEAERRELLRLLQVLHSHLASR
jgi:DNA-binding MarR family transcriptional regulator